MFAHRFLRRSALSLALTLLLTGTVSLIAAQSVLAGHTYFGGDCWRLDTPLNCRATFHYGDLQSIYIRVVNNLSDVALWDQAQSGCAKWQNYAGPQYCFPTVHTNDSLVYMKRDDSLTPPSGYTWNCSSHGCPYHSPQNIVWSEIYVPQNNSYTPTDSITVFAHELGHALGLDHHDVAGALMYPNLTPTVTGPTDIDIGPLPACSSSPPGSNGSGGVRCIYHAVY